MRGLNETGGGLRLSPAWLVWLAVFAWLAPLGLHEYWFPDEPDVALPVLEMLRRGDFIVPTAMGEPWLDYPPLTYWGGIFWSQLFGATPFALRLTPLLSGAVFLLSTASIARRVAGKDAAWQATLVGVATPIVWMMATTLQVDMPFAAPQAAGFALYLAGDGRQGRASGWLRAAAFACFGVAILAKGPLGLLLPGFILVLWHASHREWKKLFQLAPLALVALAVAALWYAPLVHRLGADYVGRELWLQNFDRFGTTTRGHGGKGGFYYVRSLAADLGPWVLMLPAALCMAWRSRADRGLRLVSLWFVVSLLFLSAASTKRNVYLLPAYPAILALLGAWLASNRDSRWLRVSLWISAALCGAAAIGFAVWLQSPLAAQPKLAALRAGMLLPSLALAAVFAVVAFGIVTLLRRRETNGALAVLSAGFLAVFTVAMWLVLPLIDSARQYSAATAAVVGHSPGDGPVGFFSPGLEKTKRAGWLCYLEGRRLQYLPDAAAAQAWLDAEPGRVLLTDPSTAPSVPGTQVLERWRLADQEWALLGAAAR
jgi:4-amino-4-deoxy-L-arabinose transferase-like glycosyltransferase